MMNFDENGVYHIYNRGNNGQKVFFNEENYLFFLRKIRKELVPYCEVLCYCLMPNHFHLIVITKEGTKAKGLNTAIAVLLRSYSRAINVQEGRSGSIFQQKTKAKELIDKGDNHTISYLAICAHYVHQNPTRANLVAYLNEWKYSSYLDLADLRNGSLCNRQLFFERSGIVKEDFIKESEAMWDFKRNEIL
ncbi:transposase [Pedobacter endophyticus]|uniref:Transposase n=1 Tax=Pedobacter endophyticus TaxID=2789740 RepID=A0A7S9L289_9SPHI|nr:transposase [Pedobacter endophyticus]QPH41127.1 transposase [Pedobacter endophyticus]